MKFLWLSFAFLATFCHGSLTGKDCKCSSEYNQQITVAGVTRTVQAYCDKWSGYKFEWCFLKGGPKAKTCPGAVKSSNGNFYWTQSSTVCANYDALASKDCKCSSEYNQQITVAGVTRTVQDYCDKWSGYKFEWCFLKGGPKAKTCPGAVKSSNGNFYWTQSSTICTSKDASANDCTCTDKYNLKSHKDEKIQAYCGRWSSSDYNWCYLNGGLKAGKCPGAVRSAEAGFDIYWTKDPSVCERSLGDCKCTDTYNVKSDKGEKIQAYCGKWSESNFDWCYIQGGSTAKSCPGAVASSEGEFYWTKHPSVCATTECKCTDKYKSSAKAYCGRWSSSNYDWCYLEGGLAASTCPGATKASGGDHFWTRDSSVCGKYIESLMKISLNALDDEEGKLASDWDNARQSCVQDSKCKVKFNGYTTKMSQVAHGFSAASDITTGISKVLKGLKYKDIAEKLGKIAPFLGAAGAMVDIVGLFGDSPEVQKLNQVINMLNQGFGKIESRFDDISNQITDVENTILQKHLATQLKEPIDTLKTTNTRISDYLRVTDKRLRKEYAEALNDDEYKKVEEAIDSIKNSFATDNVLDDSVCEVVTKYSEVDRKTVLHVNTYLFNQMVRGALNLILIGKINGKYTIEDKKNQMITMLKDISNKIEACDKSIVNSRWKNQWRIDVKNQARDYAAGKESDLAGKIDDVLENKYYWRQWMVLVYDGSIKGYQNHAVNYCSDAYFLKGWENNKYNILVGSKSSTDAHDKFSGTIKAYTTKKVKERVLFLWKERTVKVPYDAKQILDNLPKKAKSCKYPIRAVIKGRWSSRVHNFRSFIKEVDSTKGKYTVFVLG